MKGFSVARKRALRFGSKKGVVPKAKFLIPIKQLPSYPPKEELAYKSGISILVPVCNRLESVL